MSVKEQLEKALKNEAAVQVPQDKQNRFNNNTLLYFI